MNNKKLGTGFERELCEYLAKHGWWAHFMNPNQSGAQPFDILAIRNSTVLAVDCKTCSSDRFPFSRIEDNQRLSFESLIWKTNAICGFVVLHDDELYFIDFTDVIREELAGEKSIKLTEGRLLENASFRIE